MRHKKKNLFFIVTFLLVFLFGLFSFGVNSAAFSEIYIRLDRAKTSTATTGLVCAKPATAGTEADLLVVFPTGFSVSTTASNWTVATTNIPSGATAWLGIGTATAASGQTVTFPSSDLAVGTLYCFRWTNSSALTTSSSTGSKSVTLRTRDSGTSTIDSLTFGLYLVSNDQITISATVPASPTDFQADLSSSTTGSPFPQNTTIDFSLDYGSYLTYSTNITVEAEWTLGTIEGSGTPSVDILDYVVGSASNGYGSTAPVIDLTNRKITWTLNSFPANMVDQNVTFQLKTNSGYTGSSQVNFSVMGRVLGPGTQTTDSTVTRGYKYVASSTSPTSTPTPGPTATPGPAATATPTPTPALFAITGVEIRTVSHEEATIYIETNKKSTLTVRYGTSPNNLSQRVTALSSSLNHLIKLGELEPETDYYFRITAFDEAGNSITSDTFTIKSAKESEAPQIQKSTIVFTSFDVVLYHPSIEKAQTPYVVLIANSPYSFSFVIPESQIIKRIEMFIRNKSVLGLSTFAKDTENITNSVDIIEIQEGSYRGRLRSPLTTGIYELYARIYDTNGNISENKIADIRVAKPLTVLEKGTNNPIESARILLFTYDPRQQIFNPIPANAFSIRNPSYTNQRGELIFPLPLGSYKAEILAIGYEKKEIEFTLGPYEGEEYPTVYLERKTFSLIDAGLYFTSVSTDLIDQLRTLVISLSQSFRFFDLMAAAILLIFAYLTALAFSYRTNIPILSFFHYLKHRRSLKANRDNLENIGGTLQDEKIKKPVTSAEVFLLKQGNPKILAHTRTDQSGKFLFSKLPEMNYSVQVLEEGYQSIIFTEEELREAEQANKSLSILKHPREGFSLVAKTRSGVKNMVGILFESFLISSLFLEFILGLSLGWFKAAPFMTLSLFNLLLWLDHLRNKA